MCSVQIPRPETFFLFLSLFCLHFPPHPLDSVPRHNTAALCPFADAEPKCANDRLPPSSDILGGNFSFSFFYLSCQGNLPCYPWRSSGRARVRRVAVFVPMLGCFPFNPLALPSPIPPTPFSFFDRGVSRCSPCRALLLAFQSRFSLSFFLSLSSSPLQRVAPLLCSFLGGGGGSGQGGLFVLLSFQIPSSLGGSS